MSDLSRQRYHQSKTTDYNTSRNLIASHFTGNLWIESKHDQASVTIRLTREEVQFVRDECEAFLTACVVEAPAVSDAVVVEHDTTPGPDPDWVRDCREDAKMMNRHGAL